MLALKAYNLTFIQKPFDIIALLALPDFKFGEKIADGVQ